MDFNLTPEQQNALLEAASKKLGISKEKLASAAKKQRSWRFRQPCRTKNPALCKQSEGT